MGVAATVAVAVSPRCALADTPEYEAPPISYSATPPHDPVSTFRDAIQTGQVKLTHDAQRGYLESLLRELKIPTSSQTLVFSKTSFQRTLISPANPRALYFNDDTYVGFVPGGDVLEIASTDPQLGTTFYTLSQHPSAAVTAPNGAVKPTVTRQTESCLQCHGESMTRDIPGLLIRSVFPDSDGEPIFSAGTFLTTHASPLKERWGGWYVTAAAGNPAHMGNTVWKEIEGHDPQLASKAGGDLQKLPPQVHASAYLTPHSDIVALMVLEHQVEAHNRITRARFGTLRALRDEKVMADALGEPLKPGMHSDSTRGRIESSCEPLVEYLLFSDEVALTARVEGTSAFAREFAARGPRDSHGRSLRDFDLQSRLFRYPCSYLIDSPSIHALPLAAKQYLYRRLREVLSGKDTSKKFTHLSAADRTAIFEILNETNPDIRAAWKSE